MVISSDEEEKDLSSADEAEDIPRANDAMERGRTPAVQRTEVGPEADSEAAETQEDSDQGVGINNAPESDGFPASDDFPEIAAIFRAHFPEFH